MDQIPMSGNGIEPIVVYMVKRHPLESIYDMTPFRWLHMDNGFQKELRGYIGLFDPNQLSILVDECPAGPAWSQLMDGLLSGRIQTIITHLAPLTSGQRQQLIGVCAYSGAKLVTPGDGGRNSIPVLSHT
ncbi:MAG: hypothetical protein A2Z14_09055 [Chloroflexi bacterium RBG_16_48_8]|nr:MAG: hypothetical protein A2Z14_09055 [Chloroflexi bacterium RBG_16_48_8]